MANSYVEYTTSGTNINELQQAVFSYSLIDVLNANDIKAIAIKSDGSKQQFTISSRDATAKTVTLSQVPSTISSISKVRIYRQTTSDALVDFVDGARLTERDLDTAYKQGLFVAQEVSEDAAVIGTTSTNNLTLQGTTSVNDLTASGTITASGTTTLTNLTATGVVSLPSNTNLSLNNLTTTGTVQIPSGTHANHFYREGTHTVAATCSTSGTITLKDAYKTASYVKIGKLVTVTCDARVHSVSSPTGAIRLSLPFPVANDGGAYVSAIVTHGLTQQTGQIGDFFVFGNKGQSYCHIHYNTGTNLTLQAENSGINTNAEMAFNLTYFTT